MNKKPILLIILIFALSVIMSACETLPSDFVPEQVPLESSIKEIIISKGKDYDFLTDELFIQKVNELGLSNDFTVGNLDDDNIPELVVFVERNHEDIEDPGELQVYKFNGEKYDLLDKIPMNYDDSNFLLLVGKISVNQNGIYLSNNVGNHSTVNYGFILKNGKLKSVLNDKKIGLISTNKNNEIKDVNRDGILEFSIYTNDPESIEQNPVDSDKIVLWYKWDGKDAGNLVQVDRFAQATTMLRESIATLDELGLKHKDILPYLMENAPELNKNDFTDLLEEYVSFLKANINFKSNELDSLFVKYQNGYNNDYLSQQYGLSLERLNDVEYLKREKILKSETELKEHLIENLSLGYRLDTSEGKYYYLIDNQRLGDLFTKNITKEYGDYLKIVARESSMPYLKDGSLMIDRDKLGERIIEIEGFRMTYPYSKYITEVNSMYKDYVSTFIFGTPSSPNYDKTLGYTDKSISFFKEMAGKYPESHFAETLERLIKELNSTLNIFNEGTRKKVENTIL